jgi:hypothetical protein
MKRSPAPNSLGACIALLVTLLNLVGALHFALIPHGYSAVLGGVVHLHPASQQAPRQILRRAAATPALSADSVSCVGDRCPAADAPHGSVAQVELLMTGSVAFGDVRLLAEPSARSPGSRRVFLSAPKTSPPV